MSGVFDTPGRSAAKIGGCMSDLAAAERVEDGEPMGRALT